MSDWEVWAPDDATMVAAVTGMGMRYGGSWVQGTQYYWDYYKDKYIQNGTHTTVAPGGTTITVPTWVRATGVFGNLRWLGVGTVNAPQGSGITVIPLPASSPHQFA